MNGGHFIRDSKKTGRGELLKLINDPTVPINDRVTYCG